MSRPSKRLRLAFGLALALPSVLAAPYDQGWNGWSFFGGWKDGAPQDTANQQPPSGAAQKNEDWDYSNTDVQVVVVGGEAGLIFTPEVIEAPVGARIFFEFRTKNHTVTQSSFDKPCSPLDGGLRSGFLPSMLGNGSQTGPGFVVEVKDEKPIWLYCGQKLPKPHCEAGMVASINPPKEGNTFEKFKKAALALGEGSSSAPPASATTSKWEEPKPTSKWEEPAPTGSSTATPPNPYEGSVPEGLTKCDLGDISLRFPEGNLTFPEGAYINAVTIGRGTQNYTCTEGKYKSIGAVAALYDVSCLIDDPNFIQIPYAILATPRPEDANSGNADALYSFDEATQKLVNLLVHDPKTFQSADHFFTRFPNPDSPALPEFTFARFTGDENQFIISNRTASIKDPVDPIKNIDWLDLTNVDGAAASRLYRLVTAGGQPAESCDKEGTVATFEYSAFYVFLK